MGAIFLCLYSKCAFIIKIWNMAKFFYLNIVRFLYLGDSYVALTAINTKF